MMSADAKADIKQEEIKDLVAYLTKKYLQNLKINIKRGFIFHSILVGIPFVLILSVQNLLIVTKVICRKSFITVARPNTHFSGVFSGGSGFVTKGGNSEGSKPQYQKIELSSFPSHLTLFLPRLFFTQKRKNFACGAHFHRFIITTHLEKLIRIKSLSTKQCTTE